METTDAWRRIVEGADCVILGNGSYPTHELPLWLLTEARHVVCCDGSANEYIGRGYTPDAIVGDGDSLLPEYREQYAQIFHRVAEQETNDQTKAVRYAAAKGFAHIVIVGATGRREDHTIGNIALLYDYKERGLDVSMVTDDGIFVAAKDKLALSLPVGVRMSVFAMGAESMTSRGLAFPLDGVDLSRLWQGTLNRTTQEDVEICARGIFLVYLPFADKR